MTYASSWVYDKSGSVLRQENIDTDVILSLAYSKNKLEHVYTINYIYAGPCSLFIRNRDSFAVSDKAYMRL
jgi:hypothetical protein